MDFTDKLPGKVERKSRILCFHGFGTNGQMMRNQMRHLYKLMQPYAQLIFPDGPKLVAKALVIDPAVHKHLGDKHSYSWFDYRNLEQKESIRRAQQLMDELLEKYGPVDGLIGFSQGGAFVHLILILIKLNMLKNPLSKQIKFAIFICTAGWKWNTLQTDHDVHPLDFPTFHFMSKSDFLYWMSVATTAKFINPVVMHHTEGHKIPRIGMEHFVLLLEFVKQSMRRGAEEGGQRQMQKASRL